MDCYIMGEHSMFGDTLDYVSVKNTQTKEEMNGRAP